MVWTSPWHELYYVHPHVRGDGPFAVFGFDRGHFYWVYVAYFQACTAWGNVLLIHNAIRAGRVRRAQSLTVAAASLLPWLLYVLYLLDLMPWGMDSGPFSACAAGAFFGLAIFRLGMFEVVPAARDQAISSLGDGYLVTDRRGIVLDSNRAVTDLLGWEGLEAGEDIPAGRPGATEVLSLVAAGEGRIELAIPLAVPVAVEGIEAECFPAGLADGHEAARADGMSRERRLSMEASPVVDRRGRVVGRVIVIRDITRVTALVGRLRELAGTDPLTGLSNRRRFFEMAHREVEVARRSRLPLCIGIIDLDLFKDVNDNHGHMAGDLVLREAASRFRACLRSTDLICRYGGEEFAVLLPGSDAEAGLLTAERLRQGLCGQPMAFDGGAARVTASIGIHASVPEPSGAPGAILDRFLRLADEALYRAKDGGRDRVESSS
jgi:diguanylate cyclase (GGDEF)-like protein